MQRTVSISIHENTIGSNGRANQLQFVVISLQSHVPFHVDWPHVRRRRSIHTFYDYLYFSLSLFLGYGVGSSSTLSFRTITSIIINQCLAPEQMSEAHYYHCYPQAYSSRVKWRAEHKNSKQQQHHQIRRTQVQIHLPSPGCRSFDVQNEYISTHYCLLALLIG